MLFICCLPNRCFSLPWLALRRSSLFFSSRPIALCPGLIYPTLLWCTALLCATLIYLALLYFTSTSAATPASTSTYTYNIYIYTPYLALHQPYNAPPISPALRRAGQICFALPLPPAGLRSRFIFLSLLLRHSLHSPRELLLWQADAAQRCSSLLYQTLLYFAFCLLSSTLPYSTLRNSTELYSAVYYL